MKVIYGKSCITVFFEKEWIHFMDAEEIYKELCVLLTRHPSHLILDLQKVRFMDCRAMGMLVQITLLARNKGQRVILRHPATYVHLLISTLQLHTVFDVEK